MKNFIYLITIALLLTLSGTFACRPKQPEVKEPIPVRAPDLLAEYLAAEAGKETELIYNNKQLVVSGIVGSVRPENTQVILRGKEDPIIANGVVCDLISNDENKEKLSRLVRGQGIVVEGHNSGYSIGFVKLIQCEIKGS